MGYKKIRRSLSERADIFPSIEQVILRIPSSPMEGVAMSVKHYLKVS